MHFSIDDSRHVKAIQEMGARVRAIALKNRIKRFSIFFKRIHVLLWAKTDDKPIFTFIFVDAHFGLFR